MFSTTAATVEVTVPEGYSNTSIKVHSSVGSFTGPSTTLPVTRHTDQISITGSPLVYCSSIKPVTYKATHVPGLTYTWTYPSGWSCESGCNASTITLLPDGSDVQGQNVMVRGSITCASQNTQTNTAYVGINFSTALSPDFTISGPLLVCSSGNLFSLANVAPSASITWTATPSNLFTVSSGNGANATLTAANNANGQGTLTFTINSNCGNQLQIQRSVWVGLTQYLYFSASYSQSHGIMLSTPYVGGGATAQWSVNGVQHAGFDISVQPLCIDDTNQLISISLTLSNQCDSKTVCTQYMFKCPPSPTLTVWGSCGSGGGGEEPEFHEEYQYSVSPNPANQLLSISVVTSPDSRKTSESSTGESKSATTIQSIALTDINGYVKYSRQYSNGPTKAEIDVSDLKKGVYILKVSNGKHIETHRVIID
ncbi:MAG: T9SS type A sorting domain-containing protein [Cyclobacteriaceae bacterium]|nr:T9SS type A sorting domain-containing protein [Cyclobacteriaceae bacterium]